MDNKNSLQVRLELTWWIVTLVIAGGVLYPIFHSKASYPFWFENTLFIIAFITVTRYMFLLKHTFLAYRQWLKVIVAVSCIPLALYLWKEFNDFRAYVDELGLLMIFDHLSLKGQKTMASYVKSEMLFFGAAGMISTVIFPFRLLISFWRTHNRGTV